MQSPLQYQSALDAGVRCATVCRVAVSELAAGSAAEANGLLGPLLDCADTCTLIAALVARRSGFISDACDLCADICDACIAAIGERTEAFLKDCIEECGRCAEECRAATALGIMMS